MANVFVRSTDGSDADNGTTWALAKSTLTGADGVDAAGDFIYVSDNHAESTASAVSLVFAGTLTAPTYILCVDDTSDPASPTTLANSATVTTTGASNISMNFNGYIYGIIFSCASGSSNGDINILTTAALNSQLTFEKCQFKHPANSVNNEIIIGSTSNNANVSVTWINCDVRFANASQRFTLNMGKFTWRGGSILSGGTAPTSLFGGPSLYYGVDLLVDGVDLTELGSNALFSGTNIHASTKVVIRNCKIASGTTLVTASSLNEPYARLSMYNCDSGDTNYRVWIEDYAGVIRDETTIVLTGGASDGTTTIAWKLTSNANALENIAPLYTDEIYLWNETTGSSKTVTCEILHDSTTNLTDAEVWLEVTYPGTSGNPISTTVKDQRATILTTAADQTASSVTWTTTGLTNPNKQKLSVSFTPQEKGWFICRVALAKASKTIYVDPEITVS